MDYKKVFDLQKVFTEIVFTPTKKICLEKALILTLWLKFKK